MIYFGLRYLEHNANEPVSRLLNDIFDHETEDLLGNITGGRTKRALFTRFRATLGSVFKFSSAPFQRWFEWSVRAAYEWIEHCDPTVDKIIYGPEPVPLLYDHASMVEKFDECLKSTDWPENEQSPVDAAPGTGGGMSKPSKRTYESEYTNADGSIGDSRKRSQNSRGTGSYGSSLQHEMKPGMSTPSKVKRSRGVSRGGSRAGSRGGSRGGSQGGSNSQRTMRSSEHAMNTRSRAKSNPGA